MNQKKILLVEDNLSDIELTIPALEENNISNKVDIAKNGVEALEYLFRHGEYADRPDDSLEVIFLTLNVPKMDRFEVLQIIKSDSTLKDIPIVLVTSSSKEQDIVESHGLNVNAYLTKPVGSDQVANIMKQPGLSSLLTHQV